MAWFFREIFEKPWPVSREKPWIRLTEMALTWGPTPFGDVTCGLEIPYP